MAENEILDFGHRSRWRRSRTVLADPATTLNDFVHCAGQDFGETLRKLPAALRKSPALLILLRAAKGSQTALQEVVAAFTEKRLAKLVLAACELSRNDDPARVADTASKLMIDALVEQIALRAKKERRFCSPDEQASLRASLAAEFGKNLVPLSTTLEASMRGNAIRRIRPFLRPMLRLHPKDVARLSLVTARPEQAHVR